MGNHVIFSIIIATILVTSFCMVGILWRCQKFIKTRKNSISSTQKSVEKVSSSVTLQLPDTTFLKQDLETANAFSTCTQLPDTTFLKQDLETANAFSTCTLIEKSEEQEAGTTGEIISVHHDSEHYSSSSSDESFHSICNSFSSDNNIRFFNASSASSLCEVSEMISRDDSKQPKTSLPLTIINSISQSTILPPPPPPPPPPPLPRRINNSTQGSLPPTPPRFLSPLGNDGTPLPKLKPLHWEKVRAAPECSTVWDKLRASSFEFDEEMIESLFGYNLQNPLKNDEVKSISPSPSPSQHILEPKRIQNITILSKALNATAEQVCEALLNGSGLCLQELEALVKMAPAKEEEAKLLNYKGETNELSSAERFVKAILKVPFAFLRVEAMLFKETFNDEVFLLRRSLSTIEEACKELRTSRVFLKLLEAVLKTGNKMNDGTLRGGAKAFKLDALLKLSYVKGSDGKTTLLHFVVQEIARAEEPRINAIDLVSGLSTELCNVKKTASIDLDLLTRCVSNLSGGIANIQNLVVCNKELDKSSKFVKSMDAFLSDAKRSLKEVEEDERSVLLRVREITEYFHGDYVSRDESSNPLRIFVIVRDFLGMLDGVCKELTNSTNHLSVLF